MTSGRRALREAAHRILCINTGATSVGRLCPRCGSGGHGRPLVKAGAGACPAVSISYAGDLVAVAWSWTGPVGIDVEEAGPPQDGMDRAEWARREAIFKAGGGEHLIDPIQVPHGYVGMVAGSEVSWRLAGLAARSG